jgi:hypothetical protein
VNNTVRTFEEDFNRFTKCTPLVKLEKETGEPHTRSLAEPSRGCGRDVTCRVETSVSVF